MTKDTHPYGFVPIPVDGNGCPISITDTPVWHNGAQSDVLQSGELDLTITALTPTLVGNTRYAAENANQWVEKEGLPDWGIFVDAKSEETFSPVKQIVEPLRLSDGRIAIPGTSIKGMLASSIGALLAAPMSRVAEGTFSYRPNATVPNRHELGDAFRYPRPAIVDSFDSETKTLYVRVLPKLLDVEFFGREDRDDGHDVELGEAFEAEDKNSGRRLRLRKFAYHFGTDGSGNLEEAFAKSMGDTPKGPLNWVGVKGENPNSLLELTKIPRKPVGLDVLHGAIATLEHLRDTKSGHLQKSRIQVAKDKDGFQQRMIADLDEISGAFLKPNTLVYVELEKRSSGADKIVSIGLNFRYRWRHQNSIRQISTKNGMALRPILQPHPAEIVEPDGDNDAPRELSAIRLLTGYAGRSSEQDDENPAPPVGRNDFEQLAGRLAFNMAVENLPKGQSGRDDRRFLNADNGCAVPLKILGAPKPAAEMEYLDQSGIKDRRDMGAYMTYGDDPEVPPADLAGRKFYRHNPKAATDAGQFMLERQGAGYADVGSDQSSIARYISKPGTEFRVKLRYRDLREWELGAVVAALMPGQLAEDANPEGPLSPKYANKIGLGRPLGMGSVSIRVDAVKKLADDGSLLGLDGEVTLRKWIGQLKAKTNSFAGLPLKEWLGLHAFAGRPATSYPSKIEVDRRTGLRSQSIPAHYSGIRTEFTKERRKRCLVFDR